jgi:beta-lactam-binding protein with PASTA domain
VREVTVPDMIGKTMQQASHAALQSGVDLVIENKFYSTTVPAGRVVSQYPRADTVVRHGWQVRVAESLGPQQVTIPDVVGETLRNASVDIRKDQLDLGTLAHIEAPGMEDMVLAQTPPPNGGVDQPQVNLLLSSASTASANAFVLPSFVGMTSAGAIRAASELGLVVTGVGDGLLVTTQVPGEGFRAVRGDSVRVNLGGSGGQTAPVATSSPAQAGSTGTTGSTGAVAKKAPAGTTGSTGSSGAVVKKPTTGASGATGKTGTTGKTGASGATGRKLAPGPISLPTP